MLQKKTMKVSVFQQITYSFVYVIVTCLCITPAVSAYKNGTCSSKAIDDRETACFDQFNLSDAFQNGLPLPAVLTYYDINLVNLCRNLNNLTTCLDAAMSHCEMPYFDSVSYRNTLEKICHDKKTFMEAEIHCEVTDVLDKCLKQYRHAIEDLKYHIYLNRPGPPLADICTVLRNTRDCIHINETATCIRGWSEFLTTLYKGRFMSSVCTNDADNRTNGNGRISMTPSYYILLFFIWKMVSFLNSKGNRKVLISEQLML